MEVESAVRRHLLGVEEITGSVQDRVFKHRLRVKIDESGKSAIVVYRNNGWATPDPVKSAEFPILAVKCYADPKRDADGNIDAANAEDRAYALARSVSKVMHNQRGVRLGAVGSDPGLMVVTCRRWKEPTLVRQKDRHGQSSGDPLGDAVYAYVEYAMQVIH